MGFYYVIYYEGAGYNIYSESEMQYMDTSDNVSIIFYKGSYNECLEYLDYIKE